MSSETLDPRFVQSVQDALHEVCPRDLGPITYDRPIVELGLDSVSFAELLVVLEDKLDLTIEDSALKDVKTFGDLQAVVTRLTSNEPAPS